MKVKIDLALSDNRNADKNSFAQSRGNKTCVSRDKGRGGFDWAGCQSETAWADG